MIASFPPLMRYINQEQFTNIGGDLILVDTPQGTASDPQSITFTCAPPCAPPTARDVHTTVHTLTSVHRPRSKHRASTCMQQHRTSNESCTHVTRRTPHSALQSVMLVPRNGMCGSRLHQARSENRTSTCMQQHQTCKLQQKLQVAAKVARTSHDIHYNLAHASGGGGGGMGWRCARRVPDATGRLGC